MKCGLAASVLGIALLLPTAPAWSDQAPSQTAWSVAGLPATPDCIPGPDLRPPQVANSHATTQDDYPPLSVALGEQGNTIVGMIVREDGSVSDIKVLRTSGYPRLDEAAATVVVPRWKYHPATKNGKAVACPWKATIAWSLTGPAPTGQLPSIAVTTVPMGPENYTDVMRAHNEQGTALVFALVGEDGRIVAAGVANSSGFPDIDAASVKIVQSGWHFKPAEAEGRPIKSMVAIAFSWSLNSSAAPNGLPPPPPAPPPPPPHD